MTVSVTQLSIDSNQLLARPANRPAFNWIVKLFFTRIQLNHGNVPPFARTKKKRHCIYVRNPNAIEPILELPFDFSQKLHRKIYQSLGTIMAARSPNGLFPRSALSFFSTPSGLGTHPEHHSAGDVVLVSSLDMSKPTKTATAHNLVDR